MPLFRRKHAGEEPAEDSEASAGRGGRDVGRDVYKMADRYSLSGRKLQVGSREDNSVAVKASSEDNSGEVEVYSSDLRRAVYAASLAGGSMSATVRGVGGTVEVNGHPSSCDFKLRDYDRDCDVQVSVDIEALAGLVKFLDKRGGSPACPVPGDGQTADECQMEIAAWRPIRLNVRADAEDAVLVATEVVSEEWEQIETVRIPLATLTACLRLAGGDLPGTYLFNLRRGRLYASFDRKKALNMHISSDEVDGDSVIFDIDGEQLQNLRCHLEVWQKPPSNPPSTA